DNEPPSQNAVSRGALSAPRTSAVSSVRPSRRSVPSASRSREDMAFDITAYPVGPMFPCFCTPSAAGCSTLARPGSRVRLRNPGDHARAARTASTWSRALPTHGGSRGVIHLHVLDRKTGGFVRSRFIFDEIITENDCAKARAEWHVECTYMP